MDEYAIYLRKSRADVEAESRGEGDTLLRHRQALLALAKSKSLIIGEIYSEVVSGDSIASRPMMQKLLQDVEGGRWRGVIVMEIERLARGDTLDQGIVAQTFKYTGTLIVTPNKTFDPLNEVDEEYFEFNLFMSRREYNAIKRRMVRGMQASKQEGKYICSRRPYGYERVKLKGQKGWTLEPIPREAEAVRMIFELYAYGERQPDGSIIQLGKGVIADRMDELGYPRYSEGSSHWSENTIRSILGNPVYIGKIKDDWSHGVRRLSEGTVTLNRTRIDATKKVIDGLHPPIISQQLWDDVQSIVNDNRRKKASVRRNLTIKNPLVGLVVCGKCGKLMQRRPSSSLPDALICNNRHCRQMGSYSSLVEEAVLRELRSYLGSTDWQDATKGSITTGAEQLELKRRAIDAMKTQLADLDKQIDTTFDLLERGIYDTDTFMRRSQKLNTSKADLSNKISAAVEDIDNLQQRLKTQSNLIPKIKNILEVYNQIESPADKNAILSEVIDHIVYDKNVKGRGHESEFSIYLYLRLI
ncbi:MAG: recombinase family protein [Candidatus Fimivivens sp.]|nr:recombinase family protein [Candidatus Fimivivens sp.]